MAGHFKLPARRRDEFARDPFGSHDTTARSGAMLWEQFFKSTTLGLSDQEMSQRQKKEESWRGTKSVHKFLLLKANRANEIQSKITDRNKQNMRELQLKKEQERGGV